MPKNQKNKKTKKKPRILLGLFLASLLFLLASYFVLLSAILSDKETKNILIVSNNLDEHNNYISLAHLSENHERDLILFFDGSEVISIDDEYGDYSLNAVYQLLKIDKKTDQKVKSVFSNIFSIAIDEMVIINGINGDLETRKLKKIFARNLTQKMSDSISNKMNILKLYFLTDSMEIIKFDQLSDIKNSYHKLSTIEKEISQNCSVSVVNTTPKMALARRVTEIIENTGSQVVQVESSDSNIETTTIYYPDNKPECRKLIDKISGVFPVKPVLKSSIEIPSTQQFRSSVVIMIGKDY